MGRGTPHASNRRCSLTWGVFGISAFDKGGKLYRPLAVAAGAIRTELSLVAFEALHAWKTQKMHTVSMDFAQSLDIDKVVKAMRICGKVKRADVAVKAAEG